MLTILPNRKNVLMLSYIDYPYYVGLSKRISGIAKVLSMNGIAVRVLAPIVRSKEIIVDPDAQGVSVMRIDLRRFRDSNNIWATLLQWLLFNATASIIVLQYCIRNQCLIQYQSTFSAVPALMAKFFLKATVAGDDVVLVHPVIDALVLKLTDFVSTPSKATYSLAKQYGTPVVYIPNGVAGKKFNRPKTQKPTLLFVGSLSFNQNLQAVENIIKVATELDKTGLDFDVLIVGGPLSYVQNLSNNSIVKKGKVKFTGQVSYEKLVEFYAHSSIGLLPFFTENPLLGGQRIKTLEFLANGLLVISGIEGVNGISGLKPGEHYLSAKSIDEMCSIIIDTITSPEKYCEIALNGAGYVNKNCSWQALTKEYVGQIHNILEG